ncbi:MAG: hypothetical protein KAV42_06980 [Candidatus Krumholzibacteria bacterium]|nr:hypothetical protein [Candidatus Krumholzibacteria bacterium]
MILKLRPPDRRGFKSSFREKRRRKREYLYSAVSVLVVKFILLVFLVILFITSSRLFYYKLSHNPGILRYSIPAVVLIGIGVLIYYIIISIKEIKDISNTMH